MSRAGKFIPSGGKARRTGPIRAPDPTAPPPDPNAPAGAGSKRPFGKGLVKPVAKSQRLPIAIMSGIVCCLLVSVGWYTLAYLPAQRQIAEFKQQIADDQAREQKAKDDAEAARQAELARQATERCIFTVDSNPTGATVTMGDSRGTTPVKFTNLIPGTFSVVIHADGYEDYRQDVTVAADKPTDLGTITLVQKTGNLSLTSPQNGVTYKLTGPGNYSHEGQVPDKLEQLPIGDYLVMASQGDWTLSPLPITIHDQENTQKDIKFPYAKVSIVTVPPGATVRNGRTVLGQTPLSLTQLRPGDLHLSVDLPPYTLQRVDIHVPDFGNVTKQITLHQDKDFIAACGMPMVWIPDGGFWAGKYQVRQSDFENVTGYNPSSFHHPTRPVETVSWDSAMAFINKLNQYEGKAGKLPQGYHYMLPKESQWETFNADADIDQAATSRVRTLTSTQDAGYSEPNKYGLYDTLGNVWEWCLDTFDDKGDHSLRGGCWLSSTADFPSADTRNAGGPQYADRFTGFRVVLVPN
jgi:sulfatase modifying factor 1